MATLPTIQQKEVAVLEQTQLQEEKKDVNTTTNVAGTEQRGCITTQAGPEPGSTTRAEQVGRLASYLGQNQTARSRSGAGLVQQLEQQRVHWVSSLWGSETGGQTQQFRRICGKNHYGTSASGRIETQLCFCDTTKTSVFYPCNVWATESVTSSAANQQINYGLDMAEDQRIAHQTLRRMADQMNSSKYRLAWNAREKLEQGEPITRAELEEIWTIWNKDYTRLMSVAGTLTATAAHAASSNDEVWATWARVYDKINNDKRKLAAEAEQRKKDASSAAERLLLSMLNPTQRVQYLKHGYFDTEVNDRLYRISKNHNVVAINKKTGKEILSYCIHEAEQGCVPIPDRLLGHKLLLETDEALFLRTANATRLG